MEFVKGVNTMIFEPIKRSDYKWVIAIYNPELKCPYLGYLHWIEPADGSVYTCSNKNDSKSWGSPKEVKAICAWLDLAYKDGEIK